MSTDKRKLFGTDGVRGQANVVPMTADQVLKLAMAAGLVLRRGDHRHKVVIGKDTRLSGYMLEPALTAGFVSMGMDVVLLGPLPTPAVALLTRSLRADLGVMLTASHNPYQDNGIKLFGADGHKLSDETEAEIESHFFGDLTSELVSSDQLGRASRLDDARGRYIEFVKNTFPRGLRLDGLKIVVDCARGAAYKVAPTILWELGAEVIPIGVHPDGLNINRDCGATSPDFLRETVVRHGADIGIALDGDGDRLIVCDEKGAVVDGDQIMGVIAKAWSANGLLNGKAVAATVMSNLGLERYLQSLGLNLARTPVGDRYVLEYMRDHGCNLGGEQSGHIILSDYGTTGDGLIAALQVLAVMQQTPDKRASEICHVFEPLPQVLKNVRYENPVSLDDQAFQSALRDAEHRLGKAGRVLVRPSGTEPLIRVMTEGDDEKLITDIADTLCDVIAELGSAARSRAAGM